MRNHHLLMNFLIVVSATLLASAARARFGLSTNFVDVVLDRLEAGRSYDVGRMTSQAFSLTNKSEKPVTILVAPEAPASDNLKPGYEPIPDTSWIRVDPQRFAMRPGETRSLSVRVKVPKQAGSAGKHYQAGLWARTVEGTMAVGLRSRLRFSVMTEAPKADPAPSQPSLKFSQDVLMAGPAGDAVLKVRNMTDKGLRVRMRSIYFQDESSVPSGYAPAPSPDFLAFESAYVDLAAGESKDVKLLFQIPPGRAHQGQKYAFLIKAAPEPSDGTEALSRVCVQTGKN
ncbi:MAG: hypothetical protein HY548_01035 [Elusimicrobia bacterium]|nr:hypothetical protein [Elusimicrobiota bacterium]